MNNKINFQDLAASFAQNHDVTKKTAETFLRNLFDIVQEYTVSDGQVKIKGFGTFKIVEVDSRESVNVNTGERVLIEGHSKMTFTPEASLRDQVNKPFADFSTVILNPNTPLDDMETIDEEEQEETTECVSAESASEGTVHPSADSQEEVLEDKEQDDETDMPEDDTAEQEEEYDLSETTTSSHDQAPVAEQPGEEPLRRGGPRRKILEPKHEVNEGDKSMSEQMPVNHIAHQTVEQMNIGSQYVANQTIQQMVANAVKEEMKQRGGLVLSKRMLAVLTALILVLLACMFLVGYHIGFRRMTPQVSIETKQVHTPKQAAPPQAVVKQEEQKQSVGATTEKTARSESQAKAVELKRQAENYEQLAEGDYLIVGEKEPHIMARGDNMYRIAKKTYGNYRLANYIIHFNKFRNPDVVSPGTKVRLPELVKKDELR